MRQEPNIKKEHLYNDIRSKTNINELGAVLQDAKIVNHEEMAKLIAEIAKNIALFLESNSEFAEMNEEERFKILSEAISNKYLNDQFSAKSQLGPCEDARSQGSARCLRNYVIGMAGAGISGYFSFGAGWVIGVTTIQAVAIMCEGDVQSDYRACIL